MLPPWGPRAPSPPWPRSRPASPPSPPPGTAPRPRCGPGGRAGSLDCRRDSEIWWWGVVKLGYLWTPVRNISNWVFRRSSVMWPVRSIFSSAALKVEDGKWWFPIVRSIIDSTTACTTCTCRSELQNWGIRTIRTPTILTMRKGEESFQTMRMRILG